MASDPLYARCNLCDGTRVTVRPAMVDGYRRITLDESGKPVARNVTGHLPAGESCPCTQSKTPGFAETGLTMRQVERILDDHDTLLVELTNLIDGIGYSTLGPSPVVALVAFVHRYLSDPRRKTRVAYLRVCPPGASGGPPPDNNEYGNDPVVTTPSEEICPHGQNSSDGPTTLPLADTAVSPALVVRGPEVGSAVSEPVPEGLAEGGASEAADGGPAGRVRDGGRGEAG